MGLSNITSNFLYKKHSQNPEFKFIFLDKNKVLNPTYRTAFFAVLFSFMGFIYMLGKIINSIVWKQENKVSDVKQKVDSKASKKVKKIS